MVQADAQTLRLPRRPFRVVANPPYGITAGLSKFVVRPVEPGSFGSFLDGFVRELMPLQD